MTFATMTNLLTMILCIAVLVQSVRMIHALKTVRGGELLGVVDALDASTAQARVVLANLMEVLRVDCAAGSRTIGEGKSMLDELTLMTGIANAAAERIVGAASRSDLERANDHAALGNETAATSETISDEIMAEPAAPPRGRRAQARTAIAAGS